MHTCSPQLPSLDFEKAYAATDNEPRCSKPVAGHLNAQHQSALADLQGEVDRLEKENGDLRHGAGFQEGIETVLRERLATLRAQVAAHVCTDNSATVAALQAQVELLQNAVLSANDDLTAARLDYEAEVENGIALKAELARVREAWEKAREEFIRAEIGISKVAARTAHKNDERDLHTQARVIRFAIDQMRTALAAWNTRAEARALTGGHS